LKVAAFLSKPSRREIDVPVHYVGFEVPDRFVVGYGLDADQRYRELPYVAVIE
jgi:hypoxanthine phosphoribosyltransferase